MHLPNETSVTTLNAVTVNVWLWLEIILNKPRRLDLIRTRTEAINEENIMEWIGPAYQLQKAIVNPLDSVDYYVTESDSYGTAERSRDLMLMVGRLEAGAKLYIGEVLGYHN